MVGGQTAPAPFVAPLLAWYAEHGRRLGLRALRDPYAIWVAEVMSQQTQVRRVDEALPAFLARFATVGTLARAGVGDVLRAWGDLGYPRRAVALRDAARLMVERHGAQLPTGVPALLALCGIGPYTARAVAATAFGAPVTALDVNARRVMGRLLDGAPWPPAPSPGSQARADALAPVDRAADWNHALMDLGALVCRPAPDCAACPIARWCAFASTSVGSGSAPPGTGSHHAGRRVPRAGRRTPPFRDTNRYVRGRILALLRAAPVGTWAPVVPDALAVTPDRADQALRELASEGLVEVVVDGPGGPRARLAAS